MQKVFNSRRGKYVIWEKYKTNIFTYNELKKYINSFKGIDRIVELCKTEYDYFKTKQLKQLKLSHPFWMKEDIKLLNAYGELYNNFHLSIKNAKKGSKNIFSCNSETCISSLQLSYTNTGKKILSVYQRSCDLSLGYLADAITLLLFMKDYKIKELNWYIGIPHVYINNLTDTIKQFNEKIKIKMNFNIR